MSDGAAGQTALFGDDAGEPTYTVAELGARVGNALARFFRGEVWVRGEVQGLSRSKAGHCYFQLVENEPDAGRHRAQLAVTLFSSRLKVVEDRLAEVGVELADGLEVRVRGSVEFYAPQGSLQLRMSDVDPAHTLGRLAADRERLLRVLAAEGLLGRNGELPLPLVPLRVGLVTSEGSAAYTDFLTELHASGFAWEVVAVHTRVQGSGAEHRVARALRSMAGRDVDVVALVRGGGSRTELAIFDAEVIARTVAALPVPVLTGIGHEIDRCVADDVAHQCYKTPTACAAALVERVRRYLDGAVAVWAAVARVAGERLGAADARLAATARRVVRDTRGGLSLGEQALTHAGARLRRETSAGLDRSVARLDRTTGRVDGAATARVTSHDERLRVATGRIVRVAPRQMAAAERELDGLAARARALDPRRVLERGFTLTRRADGRLVRRAAELDAGSEIVTAFPDGTARSRVVASSVDHDGDTE